jgi:hypothetical protein
MTQRGEKTARKAVPPKRKRIALAEGDVRRGLKDTDRRGSPSDVPVPRKSNRS